MLSRHVNFRLFLVTALFSALCCICLYAYAAVFVLGVSLFVALMLGLFVLTTLYGVRAARKKCRLGYALAFGVSFIVCLCIIVGGCYRIAVRSRYFDGIYDVTGRVCAIDTSSGTYRLDLENVSLNGVRADGDMRISVLKTDNNIVEYINYGDILSFRADVRAVKLYSGGTINGSAYRSNLWFEATVSSDDISVDFGKPSVTERFLSSYRNLLTENMGKRYGNIAFSMITGDKHMLDSAISSNFSAAGIGHILAVSGLHVGFFALVLGFVLRKCGKYVRFGAISIFLLAYLHIAEFSPSIVRAAIMTEVSLFSAFVRGRRDILSSLCFAFTVILAVSPFYMFEAGFMLSFGALFGIACIASPLSRLLQRTGAPQKLCDAVSTAIAVNVGITPASIYFFGTYSFLSILINIVVIPYISAVFIGIIILSPLAAIPHCGILLKACEYMLVPIDMIAYGVSAVPILTVNPTAAVFLSYPAMFAMSDFLMMRRGKVSVVILSVAAMAAFCSVGAIISYDTQSLQSLSVRANAIFGFYENTRLTNYV